MNNFESLFNELENLQSRIEDLQKNMEGINQTHTSLKSDHIDLSNNNELDEDFEQSLSNIQDHLSTSISQTEEMINGLFDEERMQQINDFLKLQQSLVE